MRNLKDLLKDVGQYNLKGKKDRRVNGLYIDSRKVNEGGLFAALRGNEFDGHNFIESAISKGASSILCERLPEREYEEVTFIVVKSSKRAVGKMAHEYFERSTEKLKCVGVTGTNGKTTITTLLYNLFKELGYKVGLISTVEILVNEKKLDTSLTTPDVITLHKVLNEMMLGGCTHVFMEVSSHAADQERISGVRFEGGVFSNLSHDHLDYHGDFKSYIRAKQKFFSVLNQNAFALVNIDDKNGSVMVQNCRARKFGYSLRRLTDFKVKVLSEDIMGLHLEINGKEFYSRLYGRFNAYNLCAVYGVADLLEDFDQDDLIAKISSLGSVKGRMEVVSINPRVIVDYAHTPDALLNTIQAIRSTIRKSRLITIIGCGGDRDKMKRPQMGKIAWEESEDVIFTSDNPRSEDALEIIQEMKGELSKEDTGGLLEIEDRAMAIRVALKMASKQDTVLIAGKGHEEYQEINGVKYFFSDQQIVKDILSKDI